MNRKDSVEFALECFSEACEKMEERDYYEAAELSQNVVGILEESTEYLTYIRALTLLGVIYSTLGNENMAEDFYIKGLSWAAEHGIEKYNYYLYNNLGSSYQSLNDHEAAIRCFRKAKENLRKENCNGTELYGSWNLIIDLNIMSSCVELEKYDEAEADLIRLEKYLQEKQRDDDISYYLLLVKSLLYIRTGRVERVRKHSDKLVQGLERFSASDFFENIQKLCTVFRAMRETQKWKQTLEYFQEHFADQETVFFQMVLAEKWAEYYDYIGEKEQYTYFCVRHMQLYHKQQEIWQKERRNALDAKIKFMKKEEQYVQIQKKMKTDYLTGIGNRYSMKEDFAVLYQNHAKGCTYFAFGMLDLDYFKQLNDQLGHLQGDEYLKKVASMIRDITDGLGTVYRYGGDEFVVLLFLEDAEKVTEIADRIQMELRKMNGPYREKGIHLSVSQGYVCWPNTKEYTMKELIYHADMVLYRVKERGRDGYENHMI